MRNLFDSVLPPKQQSGTHFKGNVLHAAVLEKILKKTTATGAALSWTVLHFTAIFAHLSDKHFLSS